MSSLNCLVQSSTLSLYACSFTLTLFSAKSLYFSTFNTHMSVLRLKFCVLILFRFLSQNFSVYSLFQRFETFYLEAIFFAFNLYFNALSLNSSALSLYSRILSLYFSVMYTFQCLSLLSAYFRALKLFTQLLQTFLYCFLSTFQSLDPKFKCLEPILQYLNTFQCLEPILL
jgi:hypothetical protein